MSKKLVIVESPAKAKTIAGYLGNDYVVESSIGHIRDLPNRASEIPEKLKKETWARLGVDVENGFEPFYVIDSDKKGKVNELKKLLKSADELLIATDEDREGEAIAWHLLEVLQPKVPVRRMVFHEITRDAIQKALGETREVDQRLVDAQETRRILDRLYGYEVSPVLWKKVMQGLSAGRVQSVAVRLVVERERERRAFVSAGYWDLKGRFDPGSFEAKLTGVDGKRVAQGRDFAQDGTLKSADLARLDEAEARKLGTDWLRSYLALPNYANNLLRSGFSQEDVASVSDRLFDAIIAWGDEETVLRRVNEHLAAGADHVCVQVLTADPREFPREQWRRLGAALP